MAAKVNISKRKLSRGEQRELDVKIQFMEGIVRRDPGYVDALQLLGDHYTERGRFNEGLGVYERLSQLEPESALVFYNLACSCSLTDQFERAAESLEKAIELGYRDFNWLAKDPDLAKFRKHELYKPVAELIRHAKKSG